MPSKLPLILFLSWAGFFAFWLCQGHFEKQIETGIASASTVFFKAIQISTGLGLLTGASIAICYFYYSTWLLTAALVIGGSMVGAFLMGLVTNNSRFLGPLATIAFAGWPACACIAVWQIYLVR